MVGSTERRWTLTLLERTAVAHLAPALAVAPSQFADPGTANSELCTLGKTWTHWRGDDIQQVQRAASTPAMLRTMFDRRTKTRLLAASLGSIAVALVDTFGVALVLPLFNLAA